MCLLITKFSESEYARIIIIYEHTEIYIYCNNYKINLTKFIVPFLLTLLYNLMR